MPSAKILDFQKLSHYSTAKTVANHKKKTKVIFRISTIKLTKKSVLFLGTKNCVDQCFLFGHLKCYLLRKQLHLDDVTKVQSSPSHLTPHSWKKVFMHSYTNKTCINLDIDYMEMKHSSAGNIWTMLYLHNIKHVGLVNVYTFLDKIF